MSERVITIKMPSSLLKEIKSLTVEQHYLDISEQIRSVVRQKCFKYMAPYEDLQDVKKDLEQQLNTSSKLRKEQILAQLQRLLEEDS